MELRSLPFNLNRQIVAWSPLLLHCLFGVHEEAVGVGDGTRTRGHRGHNPVLYLLSYAHRGNPRIVVCHGAEEQAK